MSTIIESISRGLSKALVCIGFTLLLFVFLLFGSSMRTFDKQSIRYKVENQVRRLRII